MAQPADGFDRTRQTAFGYHPDAVEVGELAPPMHLLDGIVSEDGRSCVDIMHDAETNTFALVEERQDPGIIEAAELETRRADLVQQVELRAQRVQRDSRGAA